MYTLYTYYQYAILFMGICLSILLFAKTIEIIDLIYFIHRIGSKFSKELLESCVIERTIDMSAINNITIKYDFPKTGPHGRFSSVMNRIKPKFISVCLLGIFHFPYLVLLLSFTTFATPTISTSRIVLICYITLLWVSCVIYLFDLLWHQYILGYADLIQKTIGLHPERRQLDKDMHPNIFLRDFLKLLLSTLVVFIVAYGAIYFGFEKLHPYSFKHIRLGLPGTIDALYYSLATITTTGSGPISPNSTVSILIASSEIVVGVSILVVFVLAFAASQQTPLRFMSNIPSKRSAEPLAVASDRRYIHQMGLLRRFRKKTR